MLFRRLDPSKIYKNFQHEKFTDFADWQSKAVTATQALVNWQALHPVRQKGESLPVESDVYGALKACLKTYFCGKCGYCESDFDTVAWGDVEHYRPKRSVTDDKTHPGYYWLAYSEGNLMPSCQLCNQGQGKRNWFPIAGKRATGPSDNLAAELPLLLNPYEQADCGEHAAHIQYVFEELDWELVPTGRVEGLTDRGLKSIEIYNLNRDALVGRRRKNQQAAINALRLAAITPAGLAQTWESFFSPDQEHASAVRATCWRWLEHYKKLLDRATHGLPQ